MVHDFFSLIKHVLRLHKTQNNIKYYYISDKTQIILIQFSIIEKSF